MILALLLAVATLPGGGSLPSERAGQGDAERPVTPLGSPQGWVTSDDYPPEALRAHVTGITAFRLDVDAAGAVSRCTIMGSSGSELLDRTTCTLLSRRARFIPALDAHGRAVGGGYVSRFRWAIPDTPTPFDNWIVVSRLGLDASGRVRMCSTASQGSSTLTVNPCAQLTMLSAEQRAKLVGDAKGPVVIDFVEEHRVEGVPMRIEPAGGVGTGIAVFRRRVSFGIDAQGQVRRCKVLDRRGEDVLHVAQYDCHPGYFYPYAGKGGKVTDTLTITRRAEPSSAPVPPPPGEDTV